MLIHHHVWRTLLWLTVLVPCFGTSAIAQPENSSHRWGSDLSLETPSWTLAQADETPEESENPTLQSGDNGPLVINLQVTLKKLGLFDSEVNGNFDGVTQAAVRTFQQEHGLAPSGIVDAATWEALEDPAAAKISAAIGAAAEEEGTEEEASADESSSPSPSNSPARNPKIRQIVMGLSLIGLGIGGFGLWKIVVPSRSQQRAKQARQRSKQRSSGEQPLLTGVPASAIPSGHLLAAAPTPATSLPSNNSITDNPPDTNTSDIHAPAPQNPITATGYEAEPFASFSPEKTSPEPSSKTLSPHSQTALVPPPPPSVIEANAIQTASASAPINHVKGNAIERSNGTAEQLTPISRLPRLDVVETLVGELQSHHPTRRRKAIWELGQRADSRAIQPLVNLMATSDSKQRSLILAALSEIGTQTLKPMKRALAMSLQDENAEVRKNAIRDLTRIYDLVAQISSLLAIATEDQDPEVRETARWALGQLNRIRANAGLEQAPNQQLLKKSVSPPETLSE